MKALFAVLAMLVLASCASLSQEACLQGDWRGIGYADGAEGRDESYLARHAEACAEIGVVPDAALWRAGRAEGLGLYCTPSNAYDIGRRGQRLRPVCQGYDTGPLVRANAQGLEYWEISQEIYRLESEIRLLDGRIDGLIGQDPMTDETRALIRAYHDDIARTERTLRLLRLQQISTRLP